MLFNKTIQYNIHIFRIYYYKIRYKWKRAVFQKVGMGKNSYTALLTTASPSDSTASSSIASYSES